MCTDKNRVSIPSYKRKGLSLTSCKAFVTLSTLFTGRVSRSAPDSREVQHNAFSKGQLLTGFQMLLHYK